MKKKVTVANNPELLPLAMVAMISCISCLCYFKCRLLCEACTVHQFQIWML